MPAAQACDWFDSLPPVLPATMRGEWRGEGVHTGHPLDGLLEACHWRGKRFDGPEAVQPLVFERVCGGAVCIRPLGARLAIAAAMRLPWLKSRAVGGLVQRLLPLLSARRPQARLRLVAWRGVRSTAIVYDHAPIRDHLRRVDQDRVLGWMELEGLRQPFFFLLRRDG
jgi:hypothetical protein